MKRLLCSLTLLLLLPFQAFAAIGATSAWEIRTTGSNNNGGGYDSGIGGAGTDYTQQAAAQQNWNGTTTTLATGGIGSTTVTSNTSVFTSAMVGSAIHLVSGTNATPGFYFVTVFTNGTTVTIDRAADNGAGGVAAGAGNLGGALADIGYTAGFAVAGNQFYVQQGTYGITSTSNNVAVGVITLPAGSSAAQPTRLIGYNATRTDFGTRPLIQAQGGFAGTATLLTAGNNTLVANVSVDAALKATTRCINGSGTGQIFYLCKVANGTNGGIAASGTGSNMRGVLCEATGCTTAGFAFRDMSYWYCVAHDNTVSGYETTGSNTHHISCVACNNTGATSDGFGNTSAPAATNSWINCVAYGNGRHGFNLTAEAFPVTCINCVAVNHTAGSAYGFNVSASSGLVQLFNCAGFNNTANVNTANLPVPAEQNFGFVTLTANPFNNAAGNDFSLGTGTGAAQCRAAGIPGATGTNNGLPFLSSTAYPDLGAVQSLSTIERKGSVGRKVF